MQSSKNKYFENISTIEELKKQYKKLAMKYHPDRGGSTEQMQELNSEYDMLFKMLNKENSTEIGEEFREIIEKIININDIDIEICGTWIWISGNTYSVKDILKENGFKWASKKGMWYWRSEENAVRSKKKLSIEEIRKKYGSDKIKTGFKQAIA